MGENNVRDIMRVKPFYTEVAYFVCVSYLQWRWKSFMMDFWQIQPGLIVQDCSSSS